MIRYGIIRSPYPDKIQARAIELLRLVDSDKLKADGLMEILGKEFSRNKRLKQDKLSLKVVRAWARKRPDLPEIMSGEIKRIRPFDEVVEKETYHEMARQVTNAISSSLINKLISNKSPPTEDRDTSR